MFPTSRIAAGRTRDGIIAIEPIDLSHKHRAPCPQCGSETLVGIPACPSCGHAPSKDPGSPKPPRPKLGSGAKPKVCRQCSYPLDGLKEPKCPECGTAFSLFTRRDWDETVSDDVARSAYRKAIVIAVAGIVLGVAVQAAFGRWVAAAVFPLVWLTSAATGMAVCLACCATWLGFSSSLPLMTVQIGAIHAATLSAMVLVGAVIPSAIGAIIVSGFIYIYMMSEMLEMDPFDARIVGFICLVVHWVAGTFAKLKGWI